MLNGKIGVSNTANIKRDIMKFSYFFLSILIFLVAINTCVYADSMCYSGGVAYPNGQLLNDKICVNGTWIPREKKEKQGSKSKKQKNSSKQKSED